MIQLWYTRIGLDRHNNHTYMRISRPCCGCGCGGEFAGTGRTDSSSITSIIITTRLYCNNNTHKQNKNTHIIVSFTCGMDPVLIYSVLSSWYGCGCGGNTYTILLFTCGIYSIHEQQQRRWHRVPYHVPTVSYNTHETYGTYVHLFIMQSTATITATATAIATTVTTKRSIIWSACHSDRNSTAPYAHCTILYVLLYYTTRKKPMTRIIHSSNK